MNVLAIGNSFSQDAARYLHGIAAADGTDLTVVNLYIGGCSLERHRQNLEADARAYSLEFNGESTGFFVSIRDSLAARNWDVVTIQQASHFSNDFGTYEPGLSALAAAVRGSCPDAKLFVHETWAYEEGSSRLRDMMHYDTQDAMFADVKSAYERAAEAIHADGMIRAGEAFQTLYHLNLKPYQRDTFHASLGSGRYVLGLVWYRTLTGRTVTGNGFRAFDEPIDEDYIRRAQAVVDGM